MNVMVRREITIQLNTDHPNIVQLYGFWDTDEAIYLLFENCDKNDLFHLVHEANTNRRRVGLGERRSQDIARQLLSALDYMHSHSLLHRDLKTGKPSHMRIRSPDFFKLRIRMHMCMLTFPTCTYNLLQSTENVFVTSAGIDFDGNERLSYKLGDLGFAINMRQERPTSVCGTRKMLSPEMLRLHKSIVKRRAQRVSQTDSGAIPQRKRSELGTYGPEVDIFSFGTSCGGFGVDLTGRSVSFYSPSY